MMQKRTSRAAAAAISNFDLESLEQRELLSSAPNLSAGDIRKILARAASQATSHQAVVVVDREGFILGIFGMSDTTPETIMQAAARARTSAAFQSEQDAFTPRTARFIVQDHFPHPIANTPGGPLYGVQFSSLRGTDVLNDLQDQLLTASGNPAAIPTISGDPGGIPLFINGKPVGGVGVAGDGQNIAFRQDSLKSPILRPKPDKSNPQSKFFNGVEESDFDEAVALAGAQGFMAPEDIRADTIFVGGLRFPFTVDDPAHGKSSRTLADLIGSGDGSLRTSPELLKASPDIITSPAPDFVEAVFSGKHGTLPKPIIPSNDTFLGNARLTAADVRRIIGNAVAQAKITRAAIRNPIGVPMVVHIAVTDLTGDILGVFRMDDGTRFSYDVAVQKARTAAFFSDDTHAFSTRAIGFMSQTYFPPGLNTGHIGPLYGFQNQLSLPNNLKGALRNGITIFPGGIPLYKNGKLVGGIGISGDGVDQDDIVAFAGSFGYRPRAAIRSDSLPESSIVSFLKRRVNDIATDFSITDALHDRAISRLNVGLEGIQLPYQKFPRNPNV